MLLKPSRRRYPRNAQSRADQLAIKEPIVEGPQIEEDEDHADQVQGAAERASDQGRGTDAIEENETISEERTVENGHDRAGAEDQDARDAVEDVIWPAN